MAWQDILKNFKEQFTATGVEQFPTTMNPDAVARISAERGNIAAKGFNTANSFIAKQAAEAKAAAEKAANAKATGAGYQKVYNAAGGYNFFDNNGNPISAFEYANAKQTRVSDVLQGSYDPTDVNFLNDLNNMAVDMTADPNTGKALYDVKTGLKMITEAYPEIFLGKGAPTGKFAEDRLKLRKETFIPPTAETPKPASGLKRFISAGDEQTKINEQDQSINSQKFINDVSPLLQNANNITDASKIVNKLWEKYGLSEALDYKKPYTDPKTQGNKAKYLQQQEIFNIGENIKANVYANAKPTTASLPF